MAITRERLVTHTVEDKLVWLDPRGDVVGEAQNLELRERGWVSAKELQIAEDKAAKLQAELDALSTKAVNEVTQLRILRADVCSVLGIADTSPSEFIVSEVKDLRDQYRLSVNREQDLKADLKILRDQLRDMTDERTECMRMLEDRGGTTLLDKVVDAHDYIAHLFTQLTQIKLNYNKVDADRNKAWSSYHDAAQDVGRARLILAKVDKDAHKGKLYEVALRFVGWVEGLRADVAALERKLSKACGAGLSEGVPGEVQLQYLGTNWEVEDTSAWTGFPPTEPVTFVPRSALRAAVADEHNLIMNAVLTEADAILASKITARLARLREGSAT